MKSICSLMMAFFLSASVAKAADKPTPKFKGKPLTYWIERLEKAETDKDQSEAGDAISAFGADAAPVMPKLIEMLDDRSKGFRSLIYIVLGQIGSAAKPAIPKLVEMLKQKSDDEGSTIIDTLQKIGPDPKEFQPILISSLEKPGMAPTALDILGSIGPDAKDAVPAIIKTLKNPVLVKSAIKTLYCIGPAAKEAIPAIRQAVMDAKARRSEKKYDDNNVRSADKALVNYDWLGGLSTLGPDAIPVQIEFLETGTTDDQYYAAVALGKIKPAVKQATPILRKLLHPKESNDSLVLFPDLEKRHHRFVLTEALWRIEKDPSIVPVLISLVEEGSENAVRLLGEIGPDAKAAIPALKKVMEGGHGGYLSDAAREALKKIDVVGTPKKE